MRLRPVIGRVATVASAFALFSGAVLFGHFAMADGQEGRQVAPPSPPAQQQTFVPSSPDVPELAGGAPPLAPTLPGGAPCASLEDAYLVISQATQSEDIGSINAALAEVENDPTGAHSDTSTPSLANRLRNALGLSPSLPPCETVLAALRDSVQLAQIASTAGPEGPTTGGIGEPPPMSPNYTPVPIGSPGARGHGYCVSLSNGCQS